MVGRRVSPDLTAKDMVMYITSVKDKFHDNPTKHYDCVMLLDDYIENRADVSTVVARLEELMKDHQDLLLGLNKLFPTEAKKTIPPEAKITIPPEATNQQTKPDDTRKKRFVEDGFVEKLKTRFCRLDTHVVKSYIEIMKRFKKGEMSRKDVYAEVVDLLYYHEDLIEDFVRNF